MSSSLCLYPSDLSDPEWEIFAHLSRPPSPEGVLKQVADARDPQRHLLPLEKRLPVAHASTRVPSVVYGAPLLQDVALGRHLGEDGHLGTGKAWIENHLGWSVEVVKHPPKARGEWQPRSDLNDLSSVWFEWVKLPPEPKRYRGTLPRRWVAERTIG